MKKGVYAISDPCYLFNKMSQDAWCALLKSTNYFDGVCTIDGYEVFGGGTAYGDGSYQDQDGREYPVDAGLLACVPMALARKYGNKKADILSFGNVVKFDKDFECDVVGNGEFHFGHIIIKTGGEDE